MYSYILSMVQLDSFHQNNSIYLYVSMEEHLFILARTICHLLLFSVTYDPVEFQYIILADCSLYYGAVNLKSKKVLVGKYVQPHSGHGALPE